MCCKPTEIFSCPGSRWEKGFSISGRGEGMDALASFPMGTPVTGGGSGEPATRSHPPAGSLGTSYRCSCCPAGVIYAPATTSPHWLLVA